MKKTYISPNCKTRALLPACDLAAVSGQNNGNTIIDGGDDGGDPGGALGKGFDFDTYNRPDVWQEDTEPEEDPDFIITHI